MLVPSTREHMQLLPFACECVYVCVCVCAFAFAPRDQTAHIPIFLHVRVTNLPGPDSITSSAATPGACCGKKRPHASTQATCTPLQQTPAHLCCRSLPVVTGFPHCTSSWRSVLSCAGLGPEQSSSGLLLPRLRSLRCTRTSET